MYPNNRKLMTSWYRVSMGESIENSDIFFRFMACWVSLNGLYNWYYFENESKAIKEKVFQLSREKYPEAKIFGLTTGLAVMKINSDLAYEPVTYSELTQDEKFWAGCKSCINYDILMSKERKNCLCTAMLYDPKDHYEPVETQEYFEKKSKVYERLLKLKQSKFLKRFKKIDRTVNRKIKTFLFNLFHF